MKLSARNKVLKYLEAVDVSPLCFCNRFKKVVGLSISEIENLNLAINKVLELAQTYDSFVYDDKEKKYCLQCKRGASRSAVDIWRHLLPTYPELSIVYVMNDLYLCFGNRDMLYCPSICKRVFRLYHNDIKKDFYMIHKDYVDEFGLIFDEWSN